MIYLLTITLIGAALRLYNIEGSLVFQGDQGRDASIVRRLITDGDIILVGPTTSVGKIQLGPLYYYFMAPWLYLWNFNPVGPAVGVAVLGIITIPLLFYIVRKMFSTPAAIFAAILYTFGNVIIIHTRTSWNPNPMPLVILLMIWGLWEAYQQQKYHFLILAWVAYALALQLHYMVLLLGPFFILIHGLILWESRSSQLKHSKGSVHKSSPATQHDPASSMAILDRHTASGSRIHIPGSKFTINRSLASNTLIGIIAFLIFAIPLIIFDLRHDFLNSRGFLEFFQKGHHTSQSLIDSIRSMEGRMFQAIGTLLGLLPNYSLRNYLSWVIFIIYAIYTGINRNHKATQMISLLTVTSIIGLGLYEGDIFEHYIGFLFPIPFIMLGAIFAYLFNIKNTLIRVVPIILTASLVYLNTTRYNFQSIGWQLSDIKQTTDLIAADAGQTVYNISLLDNSKDYRAMNYRYFAEMTGTQLLPQDNYSDAEILYLITEFPETEVDLATIDIWEIQSFSGKTITNRWQLDQNLWMYKIEPRSL